MKNTDRNTSAEPHNGRVFAGRLVRVMNWSKDSFMSSQRKNCEATRWRFQEHVSGTARVDHRFREDSASEKRNSNRPLRKPFAHGTFTLPNRRPARQAERASWNGLAWPAMFIGCLSPPCLSTKLPVVGLYPPTYLEACSSI